MLSRQTVCNYIIQTRRYNRKNCVSKKIVHKIDTINNKALSVGTNIRFNIKTGTVSTGCVLRYMGNDIGASTHETLNCNDVSIIERRSAYQQTSDRNFSKRHYVSSSVTTQIGTEHGKNISNTTNVRYNKNNGSITLHSYIHYYGKCI